MAFLGFNDGTGYIELRNVFPAPANRFRGWTPDARPIGDTGIVLATGRREVWSYRTQHTASFALEGLSPRAAVGESTLSIARRFQLHARGGGLFDVGVEDLVGTPPVVCWLAEGGDVTLTLADPGALLYTVSLVAASSAPMACVYGGIS